MNSSALLLAIATQVTVISVTVYCFYLVLKKPNPE